MDISKLTVAAITYDKGDAKRIQHFIKVHSHWRIVSVPLEDRYLTWI